MDASKITELRQKRANIWINRAQVMDASTLTWQRQIQSSKVLLTSTTEAGTKTFHDIPCNSIGGCVDASESSPPPSTSINGVQRRLPAYTAGAMSRTSVITGSSYRAPNPMFNSMGSGSRVYSSESVLYKRAGDQSCGVAPVQPIDASGTGLFIQLPRLYCNDSDIYRLADGQLYIPFGADPSGMWLNPYLPIPQPYLQPSVCSPPPGEGLYRIRLPPNSSNIVYTTSVLPDCSCHNSNVKVY